MLAEPLSRRDRVRAATVEEIKTTARRLLVEHGPDGLSLRAIARDMGMTAPALYRYFPSREDLLEHLIADLYVELGGAVAAARDAAGDDDVAGRLLAVCRRFRHWALDHTPEFGLLFGSPIEGVADPKHPDNTGSPGHAAGLQFAGVFSELIVRLYQSRPFPVPTEGEIDPRLAEQLRGYCRTLPGELPLGLVAVFLSCWVRLYGAVCVEAFGHLQFAIGEAEPMFEMELRSLADLLGASDLYRPPPRPE